MAHSEEDPLMAVQSLGDLGVFVDPQHSMDLLQVIYSFEYTLRPCREYPPPLGFSNKPK